MATNNRNRGTGGNNNNPAGHNQYDRSWMDSAKDRPFTAAAAIGGAVAAGVFLWSKRNQISDQLEGLSGQLNEWRENMTGGDTGAKSDGFMARPNWTGDRSQSEFAEEALTLKETGASSSRLADDIVDNQTKAGSVAY